MAAICTIVRKCNREWWHYATETDYKANNRDEQRGGRNRVDLQAFESTVAKLDLDAMLETDDTRRKQKLSK